MLKFIHITDTHLVQQGHALYGLDPLHRFRACVDSILAEHADAALCTVTGDLTHLGHADAYRQLREQLDRLPMPVLPVLGNHDHRQRFLERFPEVEVDANGFVQYEKAIGPYRGLFLDTNEPGVHHGVFCHARAEWLARRLAADTQPVLLFMHHPAFDLGIPPMDRIRLLETGPFVNAISGHEHRIRHLFFGHIHRPISGSWRGITFSTMRGTNHQVALSMADAQQISCSLEPPQYCVVLLGEESVVVHVHDYMDKSERFLLGA